MFRSNTAGFVHELPTSHLANVDGAASSALLARYLAHHGLKPRIYIPDRLFEGYGPNAAAIEGLIKEGARLIVTTRFPQNAASRYAQEPDFGDWSDRLEIFGLDLRHLPSVEAFCRDMVATAAAAGPNARS